MPRTHRHKKTNFQETDHYTMTYHYTSKLHLVVSVFKIISQWQVNSMYAADINLFNSQNCLVVCPQNDESVVLSAYTLSSELLLWCVKIKIKCLVHAEKTSTRNRAFSYRALYVGASQTETKILKVENFSLLQTTLFD